MNVMILSNIARGKDEPIARIQIYGGYIKFCIFFPNCDSLGILIWQVLKFKSLPSNARAPGFMASFSQETDQTIVNLIGDCFERQPPKRPRACVLMQRLTDEYNRRCAEAEGRTILLERLQKCRKLVDARRLCPDSPPDETFSEADVRVLLEYDESWESEGSGLRLAPEALFLIGAGLLWDLADPHHLEVPPTVVGRGSSSIEGRMVCNSYLTAG